jgi:AAA+ ATPase superfamily predicted ATPase
MFVGRNEELNLLKEAYNTNKSESICIYGRRRIGKSELIKQSIKNEKCNIIAFDAKDTSIDDNVESLSSIVERVYQYGKFLSFEKILAFLYEQSSKHKVILIIDEFPYLIKQNRGIISVFKNAIDKYKNTNANLKIIFSGSFIDVMKDLLSHDSPLYGRFTYRIHLKQLDYLTISKMYSNCSNLDKVLYYSVFGGVPHYATFINQNLTFKENIINIVLQSNAILMDEAEIILGSEINKLSGANMVLSAISGKNKHKHAEIFSNTSLNSAPSLSNVLNALIKMELVSKTTPINDKNNDKKTLYYIDDNFLIFYYNFLFGKSSFRMITAPSEYYETQIKDKFFNHIVPKAFEEICKQFLISQNKLKRIKPPLIEIGTY